MLEFQLQHQSFQWIVRTDFLWDWLVLSPCSPRDSQESSPTPQFKTNHFSVLIFLYGPTLLQITTGKTISLTRRTFVGKVMSLIFNKLFRFVIAFLPRSKCLLILWLQSPPVVILEPKKMKSCHCFHCLPIYLPWSDGTGCHEVMGPDAMILVFWMLSFKPTFSLTSFTFIKRLFSSSSLSAIRMVSSAYLRLLIFLPAILIPACASSSSAFHMMYSA